MSLLPVVSIPRVSLAVAPADLKPSPGLINNEFTPFQPGVRPCPAVGSGAHG
jgi:hypothetical protein